MLTLVVAIAWIVIWVLFIVLGLVTDTDEE